MSTRRCKVGDLAIVVSARLAQNVGQIVEIVATAGDSPRLTDTGPAWLVRTASGRKSLHYRFYGDRISQESTGPVPDFRLVPLRGASVRDGADRVEELRSRAPEQVQP